LFNTERYQEEGHVNMEADWSYTATSQEHQELLDTGRGKEGSSPRAFRGKWSCQHLDFRLLGSRTVRE